jgi:hypothetical protein
MNKSITSILALLALCAAPAMAVPSGINYQGTLTDDQGNPVTGTRTMSIKLYDAATGGTLLYSENIGTVDVSDGVFSFEFGAGGTSNADQTDTVAITDGTATTFQKVLSASEVVAGSVSVSDGTYTWSQAGGSSNEDDFDVAYSASLRRVSVTYFNGAPAVGRTITATYRAPALGISGALAGDNQPWAEITVDGVVQIPRQKVLAVPFAARALSVDSNSLSKAVTSKSFSIPALWREDNESNRNFGLRSGFPFSTTTASSSWWGRGSWEIPSHVRAIKTITIDYKSDSQFSSTGNVRLSVTSESSPFGVGSLFNYFSPTNTTRSTIVVPVNLPLNFNHQCRLHVWCVPGGGNAGGATVYSISLDAEVSAAAAW